MRFPLIASTFLALLSAAISPARADSGLTPLPGSQLRKEICDSMRPYIQKSCTHPTTKKVLFKISFLKVDGDYAGFEGFPVFADGSAAIPDFFPDLVWTTFLKRQGNSWKVVADLSRTDVPSDQELVEIRKKFPRDIPRSVLPDFWKPKLR